MGLTASSKRVWVSRQILDNAALNAAYASGRAPQRISALTTTFQEVGALQHNYYAADGRPRRHALVIMARGAGNAAKAAAAMEVAATAGATITTTVIHGHTGEMTTMITTTPGEIGVVHTDPHGTKEDESHGAMAPLLQTHVTAIGS